MGSSLLTVGFVLLFDSVQDEVLHAVEPDFEAASNVHPAMTADCVWIERCKDAPSRKSGTASQSGSENELLALI